MILTFITFVVLLASARAEEEHAIAFSVSPELVIDGMTDDLSIDCRTTDVITDLKKVLMMAILKEDDSGLSMVASKWSTLKMREDNKTTAKGEFSDDGAEPSYLTVNIENPTFSDEGVYSCHLIYITPVFQPIQYQSSANVTVKETPPPNYVPPKSMKCENNCDSKGVVATEGSCQVSFSVNFENQHGQPILSDHHILFDHVISNKGEAYNTETGLFKAPCDGQYYFSLSLRSRQEMDSGYVDGLIMVDDQEVARTSAFIDEPLNHIETGTNSVIVSLKEGQEVKVVMKTTSFGQIMGSTYSVFSGFFLFP